MRPGSMADALTDRLRDTVRELAPATLARILGIDDGGLPPLPVSPELAALAATLDVVVVEVQRRLPKGVGLRVRLPDAAYPRHVGLVLSVFAGALPKRGIAGTIWLPVADVAIGADHAVLTAMGLAQRQLASMAEHMRHAGHDPWW